jgi:hypothetical protein
MYQAPQTEGQAEAEFGRTPISDESSEAEGRRHQREFIIYLRSMGAGVDA